MRIAPPVAPGSWPLQAADVRCLMPRYTSTEKLANFFRNLITCQGVDLDLKHDQTGREEHDLLTDPAEQRQHTAAWEQLVSLLTPDIDQALIRLILGRSAFSTAEEREAETLASLIFFGVSGRGGEEFPDAEAPADRVECGRDVHVGMGDSRHRRLRVSTMVNAVPFSGEGWRAPTGRRTCEPWPLAPGPAAPAVVRNLGLSWQIVWQDSPGGVSRIGGQAGPRPRPYAHTTAEPRNAGPEALSAVSLPNIYLPAHDRRE